MTEEQFQPLLFLDTNALHYARLYLGFAKQHNLPPVGTSTDNPDDIIENRYRNRKKTGQSFKTGRKLVNYLLNSCNEGARIEYSPVTKVELMCGQLRGKAMLNAAEEGIPYRMWNRIDEREILDRLQSDVYAEVWQEMENLDELFSSAGIDIEESNRERMKSVWLMAQQILRFVFLDLGDCAVYASALLAEADELITDDGYFRDLVNAIENANVHREVEKREYFGKLETELKQIVADAIGIKASEVKLPKAPKNW